MNFLNLFSSGASRTRYDNIVFNFNLQNITNGFGLSPTLEITTPKALSPEQIIKEPATVQPEGSVRQLEVEGESVSKESRVELFTKQQQLINQYMHLNIQLLSKKLSNLEQIDKLPKVD